MKYKLNQTLFCCILFMLLSIAAMAHNDYNNTNIIVGNGIGIGSALAIAICWSRTRSILLSVLAGFFGWLYVIYYAIVIRNNEE